MINTYFYGFMELIKCAHLIVMCHNKFQICNCILGIWISTTDATLHYKATQLLRLVPLTATFQRAIGSLDNGHCSWLYLI